MAKNFFPEIDGGEIQVGVRNPARSTLFAP